MAKIAFIGAGSTVFAKNILGDILTIPDLRDSEIALYDIDGKRLGESKRMLDVLNMNVAGGKAKIKAYLGAENRKKALKRTDYVINAIQVGGYPSTLIDFEIPNKYGLRQTIGDTIGIGGIFRALRTIPVMLDIANDMKTVCPQALLLNYTNPMSMITGALLKHTPIKAVGLCHSVQTCAKDLLRIVGLDKQYKNIRWNIAGINHMAWLLEIESSSGKDLYPQIKSQARKILSSAFRGKCKCKDLIRLEIMLRFGYYPTESSTHHAEYYPYWIKSKYPELIGKYGILLDDYLARCIYQMENWKKQSKEFVSNPRLKHERTVEYASQIIEAIETNTPIEIHGNILNNNLITNLPTEAVVEVPCLVNQNGIQGCYVGKLPIQCAALNMTHINVHLLTIEAAIKRKKEYVYQAAFLDPHTSAELKLDDIVKLCDELIEAHGNLLPTF